MIHLLRSICGSRYAHLCLGLIALYAFSSIVTYTSHLEKVTDILKKYCYSDYMVRTSLFPKDIMEAEYFKEKYREKLSSLGKGYFDYRNKKEIQNFFIKKGLLYDVWEEKKRVSYLLASILDKGEHRVEIPEKVIFNYFILEDKKIVPFLSILMVEAEGGLSRSGTRLYIFTEIVSIIFLGGILILSGNRIPQQ